MRRVEKRNLEAKANHGSRRHVSLLLYTRLAFITIASATYSASQVLSVMSLCSLVTLVSACLRGDCGVRAARAIFTDLTLMQMSSNSSIV